MNLNRIFEWGMPGAWRCFCGRLLVLMAAVSMQHVGLAQDADGSSTIAPNRDACVLNSGTDNMFSWTLQPCEEIDGVTRYHSNRWNYRLRSWDVGDHQLSLTVRKKRNDGTEESSSTSAVLRVDPVDPKVPRLEVVYPGTGDTAHILPPLADAEVPPGWRPVEVWAAAPGGVSNVFAVVDGSRFEMSTIDGTSYVLAPDSPERQPYRRILDTGHGVEEFVIEGQAGDTHHSGVGSEHFGHDDIPALQIVIPPRGDAVKGGQGHVGVRVRDAGRNVTKVLAYWMKNCEIQYAGTEPLPTLPACATVGGIRFFNPPEVDSSTAVGTWLGTISVDEFLLSVPFRAPYLSRDNTAQLCLVAFDQVGQHSDPACIDQTLSPPATDPFLALSGPDFRVPPGERFPVKLIAEQLGFIESVQLTLSKGNEVLDDIAYTVGDRIHVEDQHYLTMPPEAVVGEAYTLRARVVGEGERATEATTLVFAGDWGERQVEIDGSRVADDTLWYANVTVKPDAELWIPGSLSSLNRLTVNGRGHVKIGSSRAQSSGEVTGRYELNVHGSLDVESDGRIDVATHDLSPAKWIRGAHGGDSFESDGRGYDDFREPRFPGSANGPWGGATYENGGGALTINAEHIRVDGVIAADGSMPADAVDGYGDYYGGAGGTLLIRAREVLGSDVLSAAGGGGNTYYNGAGGRIALWVDVIERDDDRKPLLRFDVSSGDAWGDDSEQNESGAGTAFIADSASQFGELYVGDQKKYGYYTPLGGIGRWSIAAVEAVSATHYRVYADSYNWPVPDEAAWSTGLIGQYVTLDASDRDAPIYRIVDNDAGSLVIEADNSVLSAANKQMLGVVRLDRIELGNYVWLRSDDRIYGGLFHFQYEYTFYRVFEDPRSDEVIQVDQYVNDGWRDVRVASLVANSMRVTGSGSETKFYGTVSVSGTIEANAGASLAADGFVAGNLTMDGGGISAKQSISIAHDAMLAAGGISGSTVDVGGNMLLSNSARIVVSQLLAVGGTAEVTDGAYLRSGDSLRFGDQVNVSNSGYLEARSIDVDNLANLIVEHDAVINASERLNVSGNLLGASSAQINARELEAPFTQLDGETGQVVLRTSNWTGDTGVLLDARVVPYAGTEGAAVPLAQLDINMQSTAYIGDGASVDASAVASQSRHAIYYPVCAGGSSNRHAGAGINIDGVATAGCSYGRYDHPAYPGGESGYVGYGSYGGYGGGAVSIQAEALVIYGSVLANGGSEGGAGGSIRLNAMNITGDGSVQAAGGGSTSVGAASGGRYAIFAENWDHLALKSSVVSGTTQNGRRAAAGTGFVSDAPTNPGVLSLPALSATAPATLVGAVGRKVISSVSLVSTNRWRVTAGAAWSPSSSPDQGLAGRVVMLDASNAAAPTYTILANGADWIELESVADLTPYIGQELIGYQVFEAVNIGSGAKADFEKDRVVILDPTSAASFNWTANNATPP